MFAVAILLLACTPFGLMLGCALIVNLTPSDEAFLSRSSYGHLGPEWHQDQHAARGPDDPRFVGLATQRAASSEPTLVGRYVGDDLSDSEILDYLLTNCVIDANMHIEADIYLAGETRVGDDTSFFWLQKPYIIPASDSLALMISLFLLPAMATSMFSRPRCMATLCRQCRAK